MKLILFFPGLSGSKFFFKKKFFLKKKNLKYYVVDYKDTYKNYNHLHKKIIMKIFDKIKKQKYSEIIPVFHSISSTFLLSFLEKYPKPKKIVFLESDITFKNLDWSAKINTMSFPKFTNYYNFYKKFISTTLNNLFKKKITINDINKISKDIKKYDNFFIYQFCKQSVKIIKEKKLLKKINNTKNINFKYFYGEKSLNKKLINVKKIKYIKIFKSNHYPMIENPKEFYNKLIKHV